MTCTFNAMQRSIAIRLRDCVKQMCLLSLDAEQNCVDSIESELLPVTTIHEMFPRTLPFRKLIMELAVDAIA